MKYSKLQLWERSQKYYREFPTIGMAVDVSRINFTPNCFSEMEPRIRAAFFEMDHLESGVIANLDANRLVGHYWLRNSGLAPREEICQEIEATVQLVTDFASSVHNGEISGQTLASKNLLLIDIGVSDLVLNHLCL